MRIVEAWHQHLAAEVYPVCGFVFRHQGIAADGYDVGAVDYHHRCNGQVSVHGNDFVVVQDRIHRNSIGSCGIAACLQDDAKTQRWE